MIKDILEFVFLAIFIGVSAVHLVHCWKSSPKSANTKPLLLSSLTLFYVFAAGEVSWMLMAALLTSWLGDVLLMLRGNKWFITGGVSFFISHVLFTAVYVPNINFSAVKWWIALPALVYLTVSFLVMRSVREETPKAMFVPMFLYLVANSAMNIFALMQLVSVTCLGSVLAFVGAILFFASDCILFLVRYHKNKNLIPKKNFAVMVTYILGEFLITLGLLIIK